MADLFSSMASLAGGLFGSGDDAYKDMMKQASAYADKAASYQNPFYDAGTAAIPQYQDWLSGMSDPSAFINNLMGGYSASPYSQYEQEQAIRAANNMGSASGLTGSTPMQLQAQENAANIANKDMEQWLAHVLGINTQYGQGLSTEIGRGQQSANQLSNIYGSLGNLAAGGAYNADMAKQKQLSDILSGIFGIGSSAYGAYSGSQGNGSSGGMNMSSLLPLLMMM